MTVPVRQAIDFADGRVAFLEWKGPDAAPLIVFAHANGFNATTYRRILAPLAARFRVIAFDMRGHGLTRLPLDRALIAGWKIYRDDLIRLIEALDGTNVLLAGHSLGASASLMAAAERPPGVRAIVLIEPVLPPLSLSLRSVVARALGNEDTMLPRVAAARRRRMHFVSREEAFNGFRGRGGFKTWPDDRLVMDYIEGGAVEEEGGFRLACAPEWEAANFAVFPFHLGALARRVAVPLTVLLAGRGSSASSSELGAVERAGARVMHVEGTTHFLPMERPELVCAEITAAAERAGMLREPGETRLHQL